MMRLTSGLLTIIEYGASTVFYVLCVCVYVHIDRSDIVGIMYSATSFISPRVSEKVVPVVMFETAALGWSMSVDETITL